MSGERRDNLPAKATRFVGRRRELQAIAQAIDAHQLVTLHGPAGVGKTRLALVAAAAVRDAFDQPAWLVELSALRDPELLAAEVAKSLGLPDEAAGDPRDSLARQLAESELLLVLDTCEHLVAACAELARILLDACPDLRILATSREPLGVPGEHVVLIAPLDATTAQSDAVELFLDRARAAVPGYALTPENSAAVVWLCQKLDGIPLAIELAAVRLRSMTAREIAERLNERFRILGPARTVTDRHRTLHAAVDWSYALCSPQEQRVWALLSVFPGDFSAAAAEAVGGPGTSGVLAQLAGKSVIYPVHESAPPNGTPAELPPPALAATPRYRLLDTMREFGAEVLLASDGAGARLRHRDYFLALAECAATRSADREQVSWIAWVRQESGNLRAALDYSFATPGEEASGVRLTLALRCYWLMLGTFSEGMRWHEMAMAASRRARDSPTASSSATASDGAAIRDSAWAICGAGIIAAQQGALAAAGVLLQEAAVLAAELGDDHLAASVAQTQGSVAFYGGDNEVALERFASALASFEMSGFGDPVALVCYSRLASACILAFELDRAIALCEECMRRCDEAGEQWARSTAMWVRGGARWMSGDHDRAMADALACLEVKDALGDLHTTTMCLDLIAVCLASRGASAADYARSAELCGAGDAMWEILKAPLQMGPAYAEIRKDAAAKCRDALGSDRFEAARRRGLALSLSDAVALARGESRAVAAADPKPLTRREREIAGLVATGLGNREIAQQLFLSKRTVDSHIEHIFGKLDITSRGQLSDWVAAQDSAAQGQAAQG
jgi:predicted ATPase/DNA-binding CsgD family transcriptional regulator